MRVRTHCEKLLGLSVSPTHVLIAEQKKGKVAGSATATPLQQQGWHSPAQANPRNPPDTSVGLEGR
jgi:hypothetical protein